MQVARKIQIKSWPWDFCRVKSKVLLACTSWDSGSHSWQISKTKPDIKSFVKHESGERGWGIQISHYFSYWTDIANAIPAGGTAQNFTISRQKRKLSWYIWATESRDVQNILAGTALNSNQVKVDSKDQFYLFCHDNIFYIEVDRALAVISLYCVPLSVSM